MPKPSLQHNRIIRYDERPPTNRSVPIHYHYDTVYGEQGSGSYTNWHRELEILYFTEGTADVICNGQAYPVNAGDIAVLFPYSLHYVMNTTYECKLHCLLIDTSFIAEPPFWQEGNAITTTNGDSYVQSVKRIIQELKEPSPYQSFIIKGELMSLVARLESNADSLLQNNLQKNSQHMSICSAIRHVQKNYARHIKLEEICEVAHMSRSYFSECFLQATGMSFVEFLNHIRCEKAYNMLSSNAVTTISECVFQCGFQSHSYFTRKFQQIYGFPPSQLIKRTGNNK